MDSGMDVSLRLAALIVLLLATPLALLAPGAAAADPPDSAGARQEAQRLDALPPVAPRGKAPIDHSGRAETGRASAYSARFDNRTMANGNRLNPRADIAASKTLPLGSTAKVTNLENGKSATVTVEDRGPFVDGRVVDLTPHVAQELDITSKQGVAPVVVKPITMPQPDGEVKLGAGAAEVSRAELDDAVETTKRLTTGMQADTNHRAAADNTHGATADTIGAGKAALQPPEKRPRRVATTGEAPRQPTQGAHATAGSATTRRAAEPAGKSTPPTAGSSGATGGASQSVAQNTLSSRSAEPRQPATASRTSAVPESAATGHN
jgi:rare lipoprotein A